MDRMTWIHTGWCPRTWSNAAVPGTDRCYHNLVYEPGICSCARHASVEQATELGVLKRFDAQTRSRLTFWDKTTQKDNAWPAMSTSLYAPAHRPAFTRSCVDWKHPACSPLRLVRVARSWPW